ncbi:hypothetical protein BCR43DRAFT_492847 [Syncephalastrum racemosum]|uniref:RGS domain-containing protein n=1 Tax=Syncephalastrum racemosum TaxID=13706 RepID=A0A1X2H9M9_SYNRA|nr:hypothetical protein BCR43DRAFT_492847 [Syncephalastrum racemosum]
MPLSDKVQRQFRHQPYQNGGISPSGDGLTLELVLQNQAPSPFSFREFADYLEQTYCSENLAFYMAVTGYAQSARLYFGDAPDEPDTPVFIRDQPFWFTEDATLNHEELIRFDTLKAKFDHILQRFILNNAAQEVNIPHELRQHLLHTYHQKRSYHPALLRPACIAVVELMRISAFIPFVTDPARLVSVSVMPTPSKTTTPPKKSSSSSQSPNPNALSPRRLRSSPSLASSLHQHQHQAHPPVPPVPPLPTSPVHHEFGSSLSVVTPDDGCSVSNLSMASTASSTSSSATILKRLTTSFRLRARSQSPPRLSSWRQITIPDPNAFMEKQQSPIHSSSHSNNSNNPSHQQHQHQPNNQPNMPPSAPTAMNSITTAATPPTMERGMSNSSITSTSSCNTNSSSRTSVTSPTVSAKYLTTPSSHCLSPHPTSHHLK